MSKHKGESLEVLVTLGLGGWVSLGPYSLSVIKELSGVFIDFWHNLDTGIGQINTLYHVEEC